MTRRPFLLALLLGLAVLALGLPLWLALRSATAVDSAERGSLAYRLNVPGVIKDVPVVQDCLPVLYDFAPASPPRPAFAAVSYASFAPGDEIRAALQAHFDTLSCTVLTDSPLGPGLQCGPKLQAFIDVIEEQPCNFVNVSLIIGVPQ